MGLSEVNRQQIRDPSKSYVEVVGGLFSQKSDQLVDSIVQWKGKARDSERESGCERQQLRRSKGALGKQVDLS